MKIHEYQAKDILARYGVPVPRGKAVTAAGQVRKAATDLGGKVVVKAQIHAGGRGKGRFVSKANGTAAMYAKLQRDPKGTEGAGRGARVGGVRLAKTPAQASTEAKKIPGQVSGHAPDRPGGKESPAPAN